MLSWSKSSNSLAFNQVGAYCVDTQERVAGSVDGWGGLLCSTLEHLLYEDKLSLKLLFTQSTICCVVYDFPIWWFEWARESIMNQPYGKLPQKTSSKVRWGFTKPYPIVREPELLRNPNTIGPGPGTDCTTVSKRLNEYRRSSSRGRNTHQLAASRISYLQTALSI